jgi:DNA polymerase III alpha subunit (gram-positive type)
MNIKLRNINRYCYKVLHYNLENIFERNYLIIDIEATGLNYRKEEITEIAALPILKGKKSIDKPWSSLVKIKKKIPQPIKRLTGIKNTDLKNAPDLKYVLAKLNKQYNDFIWVAQCGFEFDFPMLDNVYRRLFNKSFIFRILDTKLMFQYLHPNTKSTISTDFLTKYYGLQNLKIKRHRAPDDVKLLTEIFLKILDDYRRRKISKIIIEKAIVIKKFIPQPI